MLGLSGSNPLSLLASDSYGLARLKQACSGEYLTYGMTEGDLQAGDTSLSADGCASFRPLMSRKAVAVLGGEMPSDERVNLSVLGSHQVKNSLPGIALGLLRGATPDEIRQGLESYEGQWGRMQRVLLPCGAILLKDFYNAGPVSTSAALDLLEGLFAKKKVVVFGDMLELGDDSERYHQQVGDRIAQLNIDLLITIGERAAVAGSRAIENGFRGVVHQLKSNEHAAALLASCLEEGDLVLLKASRAMYFEHLAEKLKGLLNENLSRKGKHV